MVAIVLCGWVSDWGWCRERVLSVCCRKGIVCCAAERALSLVLQKGSQFVAESGPLVICVHGELGEV